MRPLTRRWLRVVLGLAAGGLVALAALTLWLLRDPLPRMEERRSAIAAVEEGPERRAGGMVSVSVRVRASSGLEVDLIVRTPEGGVEGGPPSPEAGGARELKPDERGRQPLYLLIGGYRTGERAALLVADTHGAVVAAMGYPYDGPLDLSGLEVLLHLPEIRRAILDTPPAIQLALDYLLARRDVDTDRVELVGVSFGAFFAPAAAALDPRVTMVWLVHGAARPREVLDHGLEPWIPYDLPRATVAALANVVFAGPLLAPGRWLPAVSPRPVVMINALDDESLPRDAVAALYESAREPKQQIWLAGPHVHPQRPDVVQRIMNVVLERAEEDGTER